MPLTPKPIACATDETLSGLLAGTIHDTDELEVHIGDCTICQQRLDKLSDSGRLDEVRSKVDRHARQWHFLGSPKRDGDLGTIDDLNIEAEIGRGGLGVVFRAFDESLDRHVAVKVITSDSGFQTDSRFQREAQAAAKVRGDHVVNVHSAGRTIDQRPYLVMPLIRGEPLRARLNRSLPDANEAARTIREVALGLQSVHDANLIHRDVKPGNILLDADDGRAKLTDFGLARELADETLTQANVLCGTPAYMSPEHSLGNQEPGETTDIYALGITLYECLTGTPPFHGQPIQVLEQHRLAEPVPPSRLNPSIPRDLENICLMAIAKQPARRYENGQSLADDLQRFLDGRPVRARETTQLERLQMWCRRNRALATSLVLLFLALTLGTVGTTAMWVKSSRNASDARRYANDLELNQKRLRESVGRFQRRIFSEQAMHWQMPDSFRAEMFADIISYLDEFATMDTPESADRGQLDELSNDYLMIAEAALDVGRYRDSEIAADRALQRIREFTGVESATGSNLYLHFRAARLAYLSRTRISKFYDWSSDSSNANQDQRIRLANECQTAIRRACEQEPGNQLWKHASKEALYLVKAAQEKLGEDDLKALRLLYEDLSSVKKIYEIQTLYAYETALSIGWLLSERCSKSEALEVMRKNIVLVGNITENLRTTKQSLADADWKKANNHARLATLLFAEGKRQEAIETAVIASSAFFNAMELRPQNRVLVDESIMLDLLLSDWLFEHGDLATAKVHLERAARKCIHLSKSDPDDLELRKRTIKMFVKIADVSVQMETNGAARREYFIAAQDCRILIANDEDKSWAFQTRLWLLFKVLEQLEIAPDDAFRNQFMGWEDGFIQGMETIYRVDSSLFRAVLDGKHQPDRPADLGFGKITEDILAED